MNIDLNKTPEEIAQDLYDEYYELDHLIETQWAKRQCAKRAILAVELALQFGNILTSTSYHHEVLNKVLIILESKTK